MERGNCVRGLHYGGVYTAAYIGNKWFFENSVGLFEKFEITAYLLQRPSLITRGKRAYIASNLGYTYCLDNIRSLATCFLIKWDRGMYFKGNASWHGYTVRGHHIQRIYIATCSKKTYMRTCSLVDKVHRHLSIVLPVQRSPWLHLETCKKVFRVIPIHWISRVISQCPGKCIVRIKFTKFHFEKDSWSKRHSVTKVVTSKTTWR